MSGILMPPTAAAETYSMLGTASITTSATPTAGATVSPASFACTGLMVQGTSVRTEYQRNGAGAFFPILPNETKFIFGITNASQIGFRRSDYAIARTTQTSHVAFSYINTSAPYSVSTQNVTTTTNSTLTPFASFPCAALEIHNKTDKNARIYVNGGTAPLALNRNSSILVSGITNANQVSAVSYDTNTAIPLYGEAFQEIPGLPRSVSSQPELISENARIYSGEVVDQTVFTMPSFFGPFTRYSGRGKVISMFRNVANSVISGGTSTDTNLITNQTYATNSTTTMFGSYTALTNTFGANSTNSFMSLLNAAFPVDVTNGSIHLTCQQIGTSGSVSSVSVDLFSSGSPTAPAANYHTLNVTADINNGLMGYNTFGARSFGINNFTAVGSGATLTAITYARINVTGTTGLVIVPGEVRFVQHASAKASIVFTFDDNWSTAVQSGLKLLGGYSYPGVLYPSPNAQKTGAQNDGNGNVTVDNMLALQHKYGWQIASQDFLLEGSTDMAIDEWLVSQAKNFVVGSAYGFDMDGLRDASYYGGGPYYVTADDVKVSQRIHASLRRFDNGAGSLGDGLPAFPFADTNPPGDPWNMRAMNVNSYGNATGTSNNNFLKMKSYIDQAVANKGIAILSGHSDWDDAVIYAAMQQVVAYVQTLEAAGLAQVVTLKDIRKNAVLPYVETSAGSTPIAITVGASPFAYTAPYGGSVSISGGTVSSVTVTRNSVVVYTSALADNIVPVRTGDIVTVTYTAAPTMYQLSN
ncbi:MAG: polysaccharide deacetylase family protein [Thiobacillus sp.]